MPRQSQEGPVRRRPPAQEGRRPERAEREEGHQDLVPPLHDHPRHGRPHHRGARRPQARARVHHRVDGRSQARRVRARPAPSGSTPAKRRRSGRAADWPSESRPTSAGHARRGALRPHVGVQGARGARPHPRQARVAQADEILQFVERDVAIVDPQVPRLGGGQRRAQRRHRSRRALRLGLLRRRGPDAEALAPPGPRPGHAHPQAHLPHHDHREPPRPRSSSAARQRRGQPTAGRAPVAAGRAAARPARRACRHAAARAAKPPRPTTRPRGRRARSRPRRRTRPSTDAVETTRSTKSIDDRRGHRRSRPRSTAADEHESTADAEADERRRGADADGADDARRTTSDGPEGQPLRVPPRRHHRLEVALVRATARSTRDYVIEDWKIRNYLMTRAAARGDQPHRGRAHP